MREKLIELMTEFYGADPMYYGVEAHSLADHLIANGVTIQEWIPVTERLPEPFVDVIAFFGWNAIDVDCVDNKGRWYSSYMDREDPTHWMPLPEPPKGE